MAEIGNDDRRRDADRPKKGGRASAAPATPHSPAPPERFTFTLNATTGEILRMEAVDATGATHELSSEEAAGFGKNGDRLTLEDLFERAFEAGIACVLGGETGEEAQEDAELSHILLQPLIQDSPAAHLMRRDVLARAILGALIDQGVKPQGAAPTNGSSKSSARTG